eukprot:3232835-Ditylum_brightwellii.AAC.1
MKYVIRDGPEELGGVDFYSLVHVQGAAHTSNFLKHWWTGSITSNLLHIALAWCQYQIRTGTPTLEHPNKKFPHMEA